MFGKEKKREAEKKDNHDAWMNDHISDLMRREAAVSKAVDADRDNQPERLQRFIDDWEADKRAYQIRAVRHGDFLTLHVSRRQRAQQARWGTDAKPERIELRTETFNIGKATSIRLHDGAAPNLNGRAQAEPDLCSKRTKPVSSPWGRP